MTISSPLPLARRWTALRAVLLMALAVLLDGASAEMRHGEVRRANQRRLRSHGSAPAAPQPRATAVSKEQLNPPPRLPPNDTYYGQMVQRAFCTACNMCLRYTETRVPYDLCYLHKGIRSEEPDCALNCRVCFTASSDTVTVEVQGKIMATEPLVNATMDPMRPLSEYVNSQTNTTASVFFLSYVEPWASPDRFNAANNPCQQEASAYTATFLIQWRTRNISAAEEKSQVMSLFQSDDFVKFLRATYPSICSVQATTYTPPPLRNQGPAPPNTNVSNNPDAAASTVDNTDPTQFVPANLPILKPGGSSNETATTTTTVPAKNYGSSEELGIKGGFTDQCVGCESEMLRCQMLNTFPYSSIGRLEYIGPDNKTRYCTGTLIDNSLVLTAAHCIYDPSLAANTTGGTGWLKGGVFNMAFDGTREHENSTALRGQYKIIGWMVLDDWEKNPLSINHGNDMAIVIVDRGADGRFPGERSQPLRFCYDNCYMDFVQLDLLGYPDNYDGGLIMTRSSFMAYKTGTHQDYHFGSGVREGASGGPLIMNLGQSEMPSRLQQIPGLAPTRNVVVAVMSGGVADKLKGLASPLSQYQGDVRFRQLYDAACSRARREKNIEAACYGIQRYGIKLPYNRI